VAELAAAIQRSPDETLVAIPPEAIEKARARMRALDDPDIVAHLIALAVKTKRIAGDGGLPVLAALALLVAEKLGSVDDAADRFGAAGIANAASLIGASAEARAPREQPKAAPTVKPKRGLSR
jgi:hypothetical protein